MTAQYRALVERTAENEESRVSEDTLVGMIRHRMRRPYWWDLDQAGLMVLWGVWLLLPGEQIPLERTSLTQIAPEWFWAVSMLSIGLLRGGACIAARLSARANLALFSGFAWTVVAGSYGLKNATGLGLPVAGWLAWAAFHSYFVTRSHERRT